MRALIIGAATLAMLVFAGLAVADGIEGAKSMKSVSATFSATTAANSQTRTCTTTDGKTISSTNATYTGTASGDPDLTGNATLQVRSTIDTTAGLGVVSGRLKIAAASGDTNAQLSAIYDHGSVVGFASGRTGTSHSSLLGNVSASFSATGGFTSGKIGGGTAGGSALELSTAKCAQSTKPVNETSSAHGTVSALSSTSITAGGLTCAVPATLTTKVATFKVGDVVEIRCSLVSGANTLSRIDGKH